MDPIKGNDANKGKDPIYRYELGEIVDQNQEKKSNRRSRRESKTLGAKGRR